MIKYSIEQNAHDFASWAAGRAASVRGKKAFSVEAAKKWLEKSDLGPGLYIGGLPAKQKDFDDWHNEQSELLIKASGIKMKHGQAAKLINVYLKSRFINEHSITHPVTDIIHPPIDLLLLMSLGCNKKNWGEKTDGWNNEGKFWRRMGRKGWSNFCSKEYQSVIKECRSGLNGKPFWMIEEYWKGHQ